MSIMNGYGTNSAGSQSFEVSVIIRVHNAALLEVDLGGIGLRISN